MRHQPATTGNNPIMIEDILDCLTRHSKSDLQAPDTLQLLLRCKQQAHAHLQNWLGMLSATWTLL